MKKVPIPSKTLNKNSLYKPSPLYRNKKRTVEIDGSDFALDNLIISYSEIKDPSAFLQLLQEQHLPYIQPVLYQYRREEGV